MNESQTPTVLLLNGPPRSGKDTLGTLIYTEARLLGLRVETAKFADYLKTAALRMFGIAEFMREDLFERRKDEPCPEFHGTTPRQVLIQLSEHFFKPMFGLTFFGRMLMKTIAARANLVDLVVVTDCGFQAEIGPLVEGDLRCHVVQLQRPETSFDGDSRGWVDLLEQRTLTVSNDSSIDWLQHCARQVLREVGLAS